MQWALVGSVIASAGLDPVWVMALGDRDHWSWNWELGCWILSFETLQRQMCVSPSPLCASRTLGSDLCSGLASVPLRQVNLTPAQGTGRILEHEGSHAAPQGVGHTAAG